MPTDTWFNAQLLKSLRKELAWTQEDLAAKSGLSVRVVAKAEAGQSVSNDTVLTLVRTFQAQGRELAAADLTVDPASLARQFLRNYVAHQAKCVEASQDILAPDIVVFVDGDPATNPIAGTYHGIDGFNEFLRKFFSIFVRAGGTLGDANLTVIGNQVIAFGHEYVHLPTVPAIEPGLVMLRMFFKGGRMVRLEDYYEVAGMMNSFRHFAKLFPQAEWAQVLRVMEESAPSTRQLYSGFSRTSSP